MKTHGQKVQETWRLARRRGVHYLAVVGILGLGALVLPTWRPFLMLALMGMGLFAVVVLLVLLLFWAMERAQDTFNPDWREDPWDDLK